MSWWHTIIADDKTETNPKELVIYSGPELIDHFNFMFENLNGFNDDHFFDISFNHTEAIFEAYYNMPANMINETIFEGYNKDKKKDRKYGKYNIDIAKGITQPFN